MEPAQTDSYDHARGHTRSQASEHGLLSLPDHLLRLIIEDECLGQHDVLALRLTCAAVQEVTCEVLFRRIRISQLCRDRDAFLPTCRNPRLARYVREVEWQEIPWFPGYLHHNVIEFIFGAVGKNSDTNETLSRFDELLEPHFWLLAVSQPVPTTTPESITASKCEGATTAADFQDEFFKAITLLPHLNIFVSRPMNSHRVIDLGDYSMRVDILLNQRDVSAPIYPNQGLFEFFFPTMGRPDSPVTRLLWQDEQRGTGYVPVLPPGVVFRQLESLSLVSLNCPFLPDENARFGPLITNMESVSNVRHLSLSVDVRDRCRLAKTLLRIPSSNGLTDWTGLVSLSILGMPMAGDQLDTILKANQTTLRHLTLRDCGVSTRVMIKVAKTVQLQLASVHVETCIDVEEVEYHNIARKDDLLNFLNGNLSPHEVEVKSCDGLQFDHCHLSTEMLTGTLPEYILDRNIVTDIVLLEEPQSHDSFASDDESTEATDCRDPRRPKWVWGRFFHEDRHSGEVYCMTVPDSDPAGRYTSVWRFVSRDGEEALGDEVLEFFEEWDPEEGDVAQPLPYCEDLDVFAVERDNWVVGDQSVQDYLGTATCEQLYKLVPPAGAVKYDEEMAHRVSQIGRRRR